MNHKTKYSAHNLIRFALFCLFIEELFLWSPESKTPDTILLRLLDKIVFSIQGETNLELTKWIFPIVLALLFSISFPEIFRTIKELVQNSISRKIVTKYIKIKKNFSFLWPILGIIFFSVLLVLVYNSLENSDSFLEYLLKARQNKPLQVLLYIITPLLSVGIWLNNFFVTTYNGNQHELVIIVGQRPGDKNYVISGPMATLERNRLLKEDEIYYTTLTITQFPPPLTIPLNLGKVNTNLTFSIKLGSIVKAEIKIKENAWWLYDAFFDLKNLTDKTDIRNSTLVTLIIDTIEQAVIEAKTEITLKIQAIAGYTTEVQVNSIISKKYRDYIENLQQIVNSKIASILNFEHKILEIIFISQKMIVNNFDESLNKDFEDIKDLFEKKGNLNHNRPKLYNLSDEQKEDVLKLVDTVFNKSKSDLKNKLLALPAYDGNKLDKV